MPPLSFFMPNRGTLGCDVEITMEEATMLKERLTGADIISIIKAEDFEEVKEKVPHEPDDRLELLKIYRTIRFRWMEELQYERYAIQA